MKIVSFFESIKIWWWVEKVQANLSIWLVEQWYDFTHLILEDRTTRNDYKWKIVSLNEKFIFWFGIKKIISLFRLWYKVAKYCKNEKVDVIIWQWDFFYMVVSLSKILFWNKSKCIWVVHTTIWIWPNYIKNILIFLLKKLDKIVLISKEEYNIFVNTYWFTSNKLEIIYNSIDLEKIDSLKNEEVKDFYFNKFTFINIWRLTYQKWQDRLIKSFAKFNKVYPETQLIILWDWELKNEYINLINNLNNKNIYLLWNKENVYKYLNNSDCFVLSSNFEGFWLVLIEAMACHIPIISTDCPSWPIEILNWNNNITDLQITENAILVPYKNNTEKYLFEAMENIYLDENLKIKLSENNIQRVKDFDVINIMKKWKSIIDNF